MDFEEPQVISFEMNKALAEELNERYIQEHIREFGGVTVTIVRNLPEEPKK